MSTAKNAVDFVRAETAQAKIFTPTDARNSYELLKLLVRTEFNATTGEQLPGSSAAFECSPLRQPR